MIKEFLKPSKEKILLTCGIIVFWFIYLFFIFNWIMSGMYLFLLPALIIPGSFFNVLREIYFLDTIVSYLILIIYWYLLSCLIIGLYKKLSSRFSANAFRKRIK